MANNPVSTAGDDGPWSLAERIKLVRNGAELSQKDFAERVGVSRSYLSEVEGGKGKPSIEMIVGIASVFPEISGDWLLTGNGSAKKSERNEVEKIDTEAMFWCVKILHGVLNSLNHHVDERNKSFFLSILYEAYISSYHRALSMGEENWSARKWGAHSCQQAADIVRHRLVDSDKAIAAGPLMPLFPEEDGSDPR